MLYFHGGGKLSFDAPGGEDGAVDEYVSDPAHPVPFVGVCDGLRFRSGIWRMIRGSRRCGRMLAGVRVRRPVWLRM